MPNSLEFTAKLSEIRTVMERQEWAKAIRLIETIGPIPEKFHGIASNILFHLYLSRNQYEQLARVSNRLDPAKSKDCVSALLLLRDQKLEYPVAVPENWTIGKWEQAIKAHAEAGQFSAMELQVCFFFLAYLNRPGLLEMLLPLAVQSGEKLDDEAVVAVLRCFLKRRWFEQARRFLWVNNLNNIAFERFNFLIDRAEKSAAEIPESTDKFLTFLRYKWGSHLPASNELSAVTT